MAKTKVCTPEEKILLHLKENGQMLKWLATQINVSVGHLHSVLKGKDGIKRSLTDKNREKINKALNTDY